MDDFYSKMVTKNTLSTPKRRLKIIHAVLIVHLAVIFLPLSFFLLTDYWKNLRKKDAITVRLVEIPKHVTAKTVKKSSGRRAVKRRSKKTPRKKIVKKQIRKKTVSKPVAEPVAKKIPETVHNKKIAKTNQRVTPAKPRYTPPSLPDDLEIIKTEDLKKVPEETAEDENDDDEVGATYAEQLVGVIYQLWNPPSKQLLNGRKPRVYVKIRFNRSGKVLSARITKGSDFLPMNRSVAELLKNLTQVPSPPPGEPTEIEFVFVPHEN